VGAIDGLIERDPARRTDSPREVAEKMAAIAEKL